MPIQLDNSIRNEMLVLYLYLKTPIINLYNPQTKLGRSSFPPHSLEMFCSCALKAYEPDFVKSNVIHFTQLPFQAKMNYSQTYTKPNVPFKGALHPKLHLWTPFLFSILETYQNLLIFSGKIRERKKTLDQDSKAPDGPRRKNFL